MTVRMTISLPDALAAQVEALVASGKYASNSDAIRAGLRGIQCVMRHLDMIHNTRGRPPQRSIEPVLARSSLWVRARQSGVLRSLTPPGSRVKKGDCLGIVTDPFRNLEDPVEAPVGGVVIGCTNLPLVTEGEAIYHIARFGRPQEAADVVDRFHNAIDPDGDQGPEAWPPII